MLGDVGRDMASSPVTRLPTQRHATSDECLDVLKRAAATVLPADVENAEGLNFEETKGVESFKKKN